jgi:putative oxidoreductase
MTNNLGLLVLRLGLGGFMFFGHGWDKLMNFSVKSSQFPDLLGIGSTGSLALATFAEFFCSLALILGLGTRLSAIPLIVTMFVAAFVAHADDPFQRKELALLYMSGFTAVFFLGAGGLSLDGMMGGNGFLRRRR